MNDHATITPSPAERARTLAAGVVPGVVHLLQSPFDTDVSVPSGPGQRRRQSWRVQHLADRDGRLNLLVADDSELGRGLRTAFEDAALPDVPCALDVLDVPPGQVCLPRARLCVTGWVDLPSAPEQRQQAERICAARPIGSLLDVGGGSSLWRLDVGEIRLTTAGGVSVIEPRDFANAEPDPLYEAEDHIVAHLQEDHLDDAIRYVLGRIEGPVSGELSEVSVVGVDRYGLDLLVVVAGAYRAIRAPFGCRVCDERSLSAALTALLRARAVPTAV
jgi:hypothetical protein